MPYGRVLDMPGQGLNKPPVLNIPGLKIWKGSGWICLNKSEYRLIMSQYGQYALVMLNMIEYAGIYLQNRVLYMPELWMFLIKRLWTRTLR